ncbi:MAG: 6-phosphofructokinase [Planctomycetes bacterium]|nr:6-phosphofructokinase [Planctomycetota bacterium]
MKLKGVAVIGQSGGPTAVINQSLVGIIEEASKYPEITGILGTLHGVAGLLKEELIDLKKESPEALERIAKTPSSALLSVRKKPSPEECARVFEVFKAHDVRYFFYIGGNDTAETLHIINKIAQESKYEFNAIHVPKTIDNDLRVTDHCPGYGSAARFVACAFMGDNLDNRSIPGIKINVVMGRHAGFLTAASILARKFDDDGPHLVYVPEVNFELDLFVQDVKRVYEKYGRCIVAVSEGVHTPDGRPVVELGEKDAHGNVQLSGSGALADFLAEQVKKGIGGKLRVRADTFGYLQRCFPGIVSEVDEHEAREVGREAVRGSFGAEGDGSVAIRRVNNNPYRVEFFMTTLDSVAKHTTCMDASYIAREGNDIRDNFIDYVRPLAGELPVMERLQAVNVPKKLA